MLKLLLLLLGLPRLVLGFCTDVPTAQPPFDYAASEIRLRQALQRNGLDPLAMPQTPCQRKVDGFEGVLEPFCLLYARSSEASAGLWSECTLTVPTDYCLLVHVCLGCPSDGSCTAEHNSFVVLTPMAGTDESSGRTAGPGGWWGEPGGRVALELCAHRCSSALFAMPTNRLHVAFVPESIPPVRGFRALHSYVKVRYLAVPSARADAAAGDHYIQEWLEAGCDNGASGKFPSMPPHGIPADGNQAVISERSAMGPAPSLAERIVHLGGGYPVFRLVADDDEDGRRLLGELVHSYLQHWLPSPLRLRLRTRSLRLSYSRQKGHRPPPPTPDGRADRGDASQPRRHCAPNYAVPRMAYPLESCQFELQGKSGRFYSPNFPDSYPELGWCSWDLQVMETQSIVVKICGFTGGDECCLHSDRLIFEESPRRNIMAMVLSCWGHDTYYYTPKGSGLSVLLVSGDRQALNSAAPRRFWAEYFVLDEWDTLDLSRLNCGESGDNSTLINVIRQPAPDADSDRMVLLSSGIEDFVNQTSLDINSLTNEWDLEVHEDRGTEEGIQQGIPYHDDRYSPFELANETRHKTALEIEFEQRLPVVPLGSKVDNVTSAILLEKKVPYISDVEVPKHITALPVLKNQTRLSMSVTVRDPSVNFHQTHNHVELPSPKSSGVNLRAAEAVNETPVAAAKAHTPGFLKPMLQSKLLGPPNVIQPTPTFLTKNTLASFLKINLISPTSVTMVTNSVTSERGIHNFPNAFSDKVLEDDVPSNTKGSLGPAFEIEPSFVQPQVMSQHFMRLNKVTTLALSGSSTQTLPTGYHGVSVDRYPSSRTAIGSESRGTAQAFDNISQSTRTSLLWKMSELIKGTKRRVASGKQMTRASAVASLIKSQPLLAFPVEASLRGPSHNAIKNKSIFSTRATRIHKGRYLQASRTRWHSFPLAGTHNVLTKPSATAQARIVATTQSLIHATTVTTSATAERTSSDVSVASNRLSILPEAASRSPLMYSAQLFSANKSDVWSPKPVIRDFMPTESVGISSSTVTANGTSSSDGPFPTAKNQDKPQSLDIGTGPFRPREYTWFEMSVDSMLQKKAREGLSFGRIVRLLSSHLSQLMEKNASDYYGSNFLSVLPRQAGWVAQGLQVQAKFHVFFRHLPRASARQLQRSLRNLPGQHLESADGALRLQLLSIDVTDVDECDVGEDLCDANAFCHNMVGSYVCFCNENYINLDPAWKGTQCQSVLAQEAPEVAAPVSPLAVALGSAACILVLLVLVGVAASSVAVKGRRRRRRLRLEANGFSCTSTPAIYFHRRWEDWDPPPAPTLSDATLVSQPRVGPPMVSASSIGAPDNLASLNGGTSTGGQWRASASADV